MRRKTQPATAAALAAALIFASVAPGVAHAESIFEISEIKPKEPSRLEKKRLKLVPGPLPAGKTFQFDGTCFFKRKNKNPWKTDLQPIPLLGLEIFEEDVLSTENGRLHVRLKDETVLEIAEKSAFRIERVRPEDFEGGEIALEFIKGILRVTATKFRPGERFSVQTSNGVLRLTGPADFYLIQFPGKKDFVLHVLEGEAEFMTVLTNDRITLGQGTGAELKLSGVVKPLGQASPELVRALKARTAL